ncbi:6829_t:CDS:1 [Acaulospora morrowiae]|uniref:6829_t:CDS:1 n=1 Tax=Acaulospora morrowiae TaxID=94023 RepID=A0A9N9BQT7_9GLOM|nr:6829_t:CDS:1 [Acaulospora morrowiae]
MKPVTFLTFLVVALYIFCMNAVGEKVRGKYFDRFFLIIFENTDYAEAVKDPYLKSLVNRPDGILLSNFYAVAHPSEPNYIAQIYGSTVGILDDADYSIPGENLVDLLEKKKISWKSYNENYPGNCYPYSFGPGNNSYARKHNPFISLETIYKSPERCAKIVNASQLDIDIKKDDVPQFSYYVPNQLNDAHDTNMTFAMGWFKSWLEPKLKQPAFTENTLFFIVFDEAESKVTNQIFASLFGSPVKPNPTHNDSTPYTHYSVLKTVEDNWNLGSLGRNDTKATPFTKYLVYPKKDKEEH